MSRWSDQSTGDFIVSGGYSTTDGWLGEVKVGDRNFLGTGNARQRRRHLRPIRARRRSVGLGAVFSRHPRLRRASSCSAGRPIASPYQSYGSNTYGATIAARHADHRDRLGVQWRYSLYDQNVTLDPASLGRDAVAADPAGRGSPDRNWSPPSASTVTYNTLDNNKSPTNGINSQLSQDLAGLGGDVKFLRTTEDVRYYHSLNGDLVGLVRAQGGYITGWGGQQVPLMNSFFGGPTMVRGFAPNGFGPRDLTPGTTMDNVGGSMYWATTAELQSAIPGVPQEYGLQGIGLCRCRQRVWLQRADGISGLGADRCRSPTPTSCAPRSASA